MTNDQNHPQSSSDGQPQAVLSQHPLSQRIGAQAELQRQVEAWQQRRNQKAVIVDWRFTTEDARLKLKHLYPSIEGKGRTPLVGVPTC